jgi:hypothetical protein
MLLYIIIGLFIIGAIFGAIVLTAILSNKPTPKPIVFFHGAFVVTALVLLLVAFFKAGYTAKLLEFSLGFFIVAALGGFTLLFIDLQKKSVPKLMAVGHPLLGIVGLVFRKVR